jgi:hypothetical protein
MSTTRRLLLASLVTLLVPAPATAGGWWTFVQTDRSSVAVGQRVKVEASLMFSSKLAAQAALDDRYYVYALRDVDWSAVTRAMTKASPGDWWSRGDAEAVELGPVDLRVGNGNLGRARAAFTLPELPARTYALMLCDAGCARPLAEVVPTRGFTVVADPATAQLAERTKRLEARLVAAQRRSLAAARAAGRRARSAELEVRALEQRLGALDRQVADPAKPSGPPLWALSGWAVAGGLATFLAFLILRRRRAESPHALDIWHPSDDELRELIASQRSRLRG